MTNNRTIRRYQRIGALLGLLAAVLYIGATDAQAHGTHYKCKSNGTKSTGTTKIHVHHAKPSKRHMRRHKCVKRTKIVTNKVSLAPAVAPAPVQTQVVEKIVYVPSTPAPCSYKCEEPKPGPKPCTCGEDTHEHQRGEGHKKCSKGRGHYRERDDD